MKTSFEKAMEMVGARLGIASLSETMHCLVALMGILLAIVFVFVSFSMFPIDGGAANLQGGAAGAGSVVSSLIA